MAKDNQSERRGRWTGTRISGFPEPLDRLVRHEYDEPSDFRRVAIALLTAAIDPSFSEAASRMLIMIGRDIERNAEDNGWMPDQIDGVHERVAKILGGDVDADASWPPDDPADGSE